MITDSENKTTLKLNSSLTSGQIDAYNKDGYVLLRSLISVGDAERLRAEVMGIMDEMVSANRSCAKRRATWLAVISTR
ncbi:MAG TPA: hypothetical protein VGK19_02140 [Capsulimonadaceae bacterium]